MAVGRALLLDDVDLSIAPGETLAIVGPNGAGKSTLLRLLSGDLSPTKGTVLLRERNIHAWSSTELALRRVMLSQHVTVSFPFTVQEIVAMGSGRQSGTASSATIDAAIDEVGLNAFRHRELPTLSGGEQQRAHFARILVQLACGESTSGPGILLLDEPTSSLDLRHQIALVESSRQRARNGTAVVAVLHDLNLAARFADRIVVLRKGKIFADGMPAETITRDMLQRVFHIDATVDRTIEGLPFILPQTMRQEAQTIDGR